MKRRDLVILVCVVLLVGGGVLILRDDGEGRGRDVVRVAVASNFTGAIEALAEQFEQTSEYEVTISFGSTGKHYAQILNGAPFDLFFAADAHRPRLLEPEGVAVAGSRMTYAMGRLVLWSPMPDLVDSEGMILERGDFEHLAIANPDLAPYGLAAMEVLEGRGLWVDLQSRIVRGENVGQAYQYVHSGNAELGFVAYSQVMRPGAAIEGSYWEVPISLYSPIEQQVVLLVESVAARAFLDFVRSDEGLDIIRGYGYGTSP